MNWGTEDEFHIAQLIEQKVDEAVQDSEKRNESALSIIEEVCVMLRGLQSSREAMAQGYVDIHVQMQRKLELLEGGGITDAMAENAVDAAREHFQFDCIEHLYESPASKTGEQWRIKELRGGDGVDAFTDFPNGSHFKDLKEAQEWLKLMAGNEELKLKQTNHVILEK